MAIVHDIPTRDLIVNAVCGANLNGGASLVFLDVSSTVMATIPLELTAFPTSVNGETSAFNFPKTGTVIFAGTITQFQIWNSLEVVKITGSVTLTGGGGDIELSSLTYALTEQINVSQLTYRVPN
jgi:hypothetical protein